MQFLGRNVKLLPVKAPSQPAAMKRTADANDLNQTPLQEDMPSEGGCYSNSDRGMLSSRAGRCTGILHQSL
jgi:hypothetical protein